MRIFLGNYYLLTNKKCLTYIKQHLNSQEFEFLRKSYAIAVAMATMTFQDGRYLALK
jgi:hypothetical protein